MHTMIEHYEADRIPNENPLEDTPFEVWNETREAIVACCQKFGVVGPDDKINVLFGLKKPSPSVNLDQCDFWVVDDQYNDELYHYIEIYNRTVLTPAWLEAIMAVLRHHPGWGIGIKNIRFAYLLIFGEKIMVTGYPFMNCHDVESVARAASENLWGVTGEVDPYISSEYNQTELMNAPICGCFYCCSIFPPSEIKEWVGNAMRGLDQTAVCPHCGTQNVIAPKPTFTLSPDALRHMSALAFGPFELRQPKPQEPSDGNG